MRKDHVVFKIKRVYEPKYIDRLRLFIVKYKNTKERLQAFNLHNSVSFVQIELLDTVALNLHRIDKDVQRCDRNYYYFTTTNLEKLRNIMCR